MIQLSILLLSLLFTGVVEAGDLLNTLKLKKVVKDGGDVLVTCNDELTACWTPCEVRMQEAMKSISPFLSKTGDITIREAVYLSPAARLRQEAEAIDREDAAVQQFRDVMKECAQ